MNDDREVRHQAKERSPNYPGIPLDDAIQQARKLYARERRNQVPVDAACAAWGYAPTSSGGKIVLAALVRFGLLVSQGSGPRRRVHLSNEAIAIIHDERPGSTEYIERIQRAALRPPLHAELWTQFGRNGGLPSDETLKFELIVQRKFTESGARDFIKQFRATVEFARLADGDLTQDSETNNAGAGEGVEQRVPVSPADTAALEPVSRMQTPLPSSAAGTQVSAQVAPPGVEMRVLQIPVDAPAWPMLQVPYPMTEEAWEQMIEALAVFKRGVVRRSLPNDQASSE